jgi:CBS domain-containing protein
MNASSLMTADPETVTPETHLVTAAARMIELGLRHLPVVDEGQRLVGMISDRDVRTALGSPSDAVRGQREGELEELTVDSVMANDPIRVELDAPVKTIADVLATEKIGAVPVVDEGERVVGIVSYVDVLAYFAAREA